jgi:hypothetical protein
MRLVSGCGLCRHLLLPLTVLCWWQTKSTIESTVSSHALRNALSSSVRCMVTLTNS